MKTNGLNRLTAWLLALLMVFNMAPVSAFASEGNVPDEVSYLGGTQYTSDISTETDESETQNSQDPDNGTDETRSSYTVHHLLYGTTDKKVKNDDTGEADIGTEITIETAETYQDTDNTVVPVDPTNSLTVGAVAENNVVTIYYKIPVTVKANDATKKYGEPDPDQFAVATEGALLEGDILSYKAVREPGEEIGEYPINVTEPRIAKADSEEELPYYEITPENGVLTIVREDETLSLGGNDYVIARIEGNKGVVLPSDYKDGAHRKLLMDKTAQVIEGKIWYDTFEDPLWSLTHVSGNWYYISIDGQYINIGENGAVYLSTEPFAIQVTKSSNKYKLSVGTQVLEAVGGSPDNGFGVAQNSNQTFALYSSEEISNWTSLSINNGSYFIAGKEGATEPYAVLKHAKTKNLMLARVETNKAKINYPYQTNDVWLAGVPFYEHGSSVEPLGMGHKWTFRQIKRDWYAVIAPDGSYLNLIDSGATLGAEQPLLIKQNGDAYRISDDVWLTSITPLYLADNMSSAENGFGSTRAQKNVYLYEDETSSDHTSLSGDDYIINDDYMVAIIGDIKESGTLKALRISSFTSDSVEAAEEPTVWTFTRASGANWYYISTGNRYLSVDENGLSLTGSSTPVYVEKIGNEYFL